MMIQNKPKTSFVLFLQNIKHIFVLLE